MRCLGFCLGTQAAAYPAGRKLHRRKSWLSCWARSRPSTYATPFLRLRAGQQGPRSASHSGLPRPPRFPTHSALHTDGGAPVRRSVVAGSCSGCEKEEGRRTDMRRGSMAPAANRDSSHSWAQNRDLATVARARDAKCGIESSHDAARLLANYSDALVF